MLQETRYTFFKKKQFIHLIIWGNKIVKRIYIWSLLLLSICLLLFITVETRDSSINQLISVGIYPENQPDSGKTIQSGFYVRLYGLIIQMKTQTQLKVLQEHLQYDVQAGELLPIKGDSDSLNNQTVAKN